MFNKSIPIFKKTGRVKINPSEVIASVEFDSENGGDTMTKPSYWVYLKPGFVTEGGYGCHIIHEDSLKEVKNMIAGIVYDEYDKT